MNTCGIVLLALVLFLLYRYYTHPDLTETFEDSTCPYKRIRITLDNDQKDGFLVKLYKTEKSDEPYRTEKQKNLQSLQLYLQRIIENNEICQNNIENATNLNSEVFLRCPYEKIQVIESKNVKNSTSKYKIVFDNTKFSPGQTLKAVKLAVKGIKNSFPKCTIENTTDQEISGTVKVLKAVGVESPISTTTVSTTPAESIGSLSTPSNIPSLKPSSTVNLTDKAITDELSKLGDNAEKNADRLRQLNLKMEREKQLSRDEHQELMNLSSKLRNQSHRTEFLAQQREERQKELDRQLNNLHSDLKDLNRLKAQYPESHQTRDLYQSINTNKNQLERHGSRLNNIEQTLYDTRACVENSKTLLQDINAKMTNILMHRDTQQPEQETVKVVADNLARCPPCPLYAPLGTPNLLEVKYKK